MKRFKKVLNLMLSLFMLFSVIDYSMVREVSAAEPTTEMGTAFTGTVADIAQFTNANQTVTIKVLKGTTVIGTEINVDGANGQFVIPSIPVGVYKLDVIVESGNSTPYSIERKYVVTKDESYIMYDGSRVLNNQVEFKKHNGIIIGASISDWSDPTRFLPIGCDNLEMIYDLDEYSPTKSIYSYLRAYALYSFGNYEQSHYSNEKIAQLNNYLESNKIKKLAAYTLQLSNNQVAYQVIFDFIPSLIIDKNNVEQLKSLSPLKMYMDIPEELYDKSGLQILRIYDNRVEVENVSADPLTHSISFEGYVGAELPIYALVYDEPDNKKLNVYASYVKTIDNSGEQIKLSNNAILDSHNATARLYKSNDLVSDNLPSFNIVDGKFTLEGIDDGVYSLYISSIGHYGTTRKLIVEDGNISIVGSPANDKFTMSYEGMNIVNGSAEGLPAMVFDNLEDSLDIVNEEIDLSLANLKDITLIANVPSSEELSIAQEKSALIGKAVSNAFKLNLTVEGEERLIANQLNGTIDIPADIVNREGIDVLCIHSDGTSNLIGTDYNSKLNTISFNSHVANSIEEQPIYALVYDIPTYSVFGTVLDKYGTAIEKAEVYLYDENGELVDVEPNPVQTIEGEYAFTNVPNGNYTVEVKDPDGNVYQNKVEVKDGNPEPIEVKTDYANITVNRPSLEVKIVDENGQLLNSDNGVTGIVADIYRPHNWEKVENSQKEYLKQWNISNGTIDGILNFELDPGIYLMRVTVSPANTERTIIRSLTVTEDKILIDNKDTDQFMVYDALGLTNQATSISLHDKFVFNEIESAFALKDANGKFDFNKASQEFAESSKPVVIGDGNSMMHFNISAIELGEDSYPELLQGQNIVSLFNFQIHGRGIINGEIFPEQPNGVTTIKDAELKNRISVTRLVPENLVQENRNWNVVAIQDGEVKTVTTDYYSDINAIAFDTLENGEGAVYALVYTDTYSISGVVKDEASSGVEGATVELLDEEGKVVATATTDENGNYEFKNLPNGKYRVRVTYEGKIGESDITIDGSDVTGKDVTVEPIPVATGSDLIVVGKLPEANEANNMPRVEDGTGKEIESYISTATSGDLADYRDGKYEGETLPENFSYVFEGVSAENANDIKVFIEGNEYTPTKVFLDETTGKYTAVLSYEDYLSQKEAYEGGTDPEPEPEPEPTRPTGPTYSTSIDKNTDGTVKVNSKGTDGSKVTIIDKTPSKDASKSFDVKFDGSFLNPATITVKVNEEDGTVVKVRKTVNGESVIEEYTVKNGEIAIKVDPKDKVSIEILKDELDMNDLSAYSNMKLDVYANSRVISVTPNANGFDVYGYMWINNVQPTKDTWREIIFVNAEDYATSKAYRANVVADYNPFLNANKQATNNGTLDLSYACYEGGVNPLSMESYDKSGKGAMAQGTYLVFMRISDGTDSYLFPLVDRMLDNGTTMESDGTLPAGFSVVDEETRNLVYTVK